MTTIDATTSAARTPGAAGPSRGRTLAVIRLHLINRMSVFGIPWMILAFVLLVNLVIWWIIFTAVSDPESRADAQSGLQYSGASFYIFVYALVLAIQMIALTFPLALGFSVTRREFWTGSALTWLLLALVNSAGMTVLAVIEELTNGWGFGGTMFTALYFGGADAPWYLRFFLFFCIFVFFSFVGAMIALIYQRWRVNGMLVFFGALILVLVGAVALVTLTDGWPAVGAWFVAMGATGVVSWSLVPTAVAALVGFALIRHTTPKN